MGDLVEFVELAAAVMELGELQALLPEGCAFTASTAARAYGRMPLSGMPPEVVVRWLIKMVGGAVEEELSADRLQIPVEQLRKHGEDGDLIALEIDGRTVYPAFQMKDAMTVLTVRETLAVLPLRNQWRRTEWFLTHPLGLG